jgi:hypothetical protein
MDSTGAQLSTAEIEAIVGMTLSSEARSGLEKLIADASASAFFRFFCLPDGVGDPEVQPVESWTYQQVVFNVGVFTAPSVDVFLHPPSKEVDLRTELW